jgi:putative DNA primase/helicase
MNEARRPEPVEKNSVETIAKLLMQQHHITYQSGTFYIYDESTKCWDDLELDDLKLMLLQFMTEHTYSQQKVNTAIELIRIHVSEKEPQHNPDEILFANGLYNTQTREFREYTAEDRALNTFEANYSPGATCPRWLQFLDEIFEGDPDSQDKRNLLQEFIGYSLTRSTVYEKALLLIGGGANGKSKVLDVLKAIFGEKQTSSLELWQLTDRFSSAAIKDKYVNIATELGNRDLFSEAKFKQITSGETIASEIKFGATFQFKPFAKLIFAANQLPITTDITAAYFRRWLILNFNQVFDYDRRDEHLSEKLLQEIDGIAFWALDGLDRLKTNRRFTEPASHHESLKYYQVGSSSVNAFVDEMIKASTGSSIQLGEIYRRYVGYCSDSGYRAKSKMNFRNDLLRAIPAAVFSTSHGQRVIQNIKMLNDYEPML